MNSTGLKEAFRESNKTKVKKAWANGEEVQYEFEGEWFDWDDPDYLALDEGSWRVKPKVLYINKREVPEPLREKTGADVYVWEMYLKITPNPSEQELEEGRVHATFDAVRAHRAALISFTKEKK